MKDAPYRGRQGTCGGNAIDFVSGHACIAVYRVHEQSIEVLHETAGEYRALPRCSLPNSVNVTKIA